MPLRGVNFARRLGVNIECRLTDSTDPADIQAYLDRYPAGAYEALARNRLKRLTGSQEEKSVVQVAVTPDEPERVVLPEAPPPTPEAVEASLGLDREERRRIQRNLAALGLYADAADGLFGRHTRKALKTWQSSQKMVATGYLYVESAKALLAAHPETSITVQTVPPSANVRVFTASGSTYQDAMVVQPGLYEIAVDAPHHELFRQPLAVEGPTIYKIALCKLEEKAEKVCKDRPVMRTKHVQKHLDRRIEGRGTQSIPQGYTRGAWIGWEHILVEKLWPYWKTAKENASKSIKESCDSLDGRVDGESFLIVRKECGSRVPKDSVLIVASLVCKGVLQMVEETYASTEKECQDTIDDVRICPD